MANDSRRAFLGKASVGLPAAAVLGSGITAAAAATESQTRRVVPGSPGAPFSRATILDNLIYVAGVVGTKPGSQDLPTTPFGPQCRQAMENLKASVEASGSDMSQVLKCGCFLTNIDDFPAMNTLFREYFPKNPPARSTVVVKELVVAGARIEIDCVAALP